MIGNELLCSIIGTYACLTLITFRHVVQYINKNWPNRNRISYNTLAKCCLNGMKYRKSFHFFGLVFVFVFLYCFCVNSLTFLWKIENSLGMPVSHLYLKMFIKWIFFIKLFILAVSFSYFRLKTICNSLFVGKSSQKKTNLQNKLQWLFSV